MAKKRKIMVDVVVDDKGTTKKMAVSQRQLDGAMKNTEKSTRAARKQIRGAAQTASAGGKQFAALASGTGGLVGAYATLAAQIFAVTAAFNFLKEAGSLKLLQEGQLAYTAAVGTSMKALTQDIQAATGSQLQFREAAQAAAIGTAAGLSPTQITALGKAAKDTSTVLGRDLTDSFNRLVRGVTKAEPELLDELGIILRLETATENYKRSLGITGELSAFQRSQAVTAEVLGQVEEKYAKVLAVTGASENEFAKLGAAFDEIVMSIQEFAVKFLTPIAQLLQKFPQLIIAAFAPFTISILRAGLPSLGNLSVALGDFATKAKTSYAAAQTAQLKYATDVNKLAASKTMQKALLKEIGAETKAATQKVKINKGSLLAQLRDGKQLSNRQLKQIQLNLDRQARGYKIKDKKILASLQVTMKKMELLNKATTDKMKLQFQTLGFKISSSFQAAAVQSKAAIAGLAQFTARAAGFMAAALSAISWISLIAGLGALVYAFFRTKDAVEDTEEKYSALAEKNKTLREETEKFIQTQNILNDTLDHGNNVLEAFGKRIENVSSASLANAIGDGAAFQTILSEYNKQILEVSKTLPGLETELDKLERRKNTLANLPNQTKKVNRDQVENQREIESVMQQINDATVAANTSFAEFTKGTEGLDKAGVNAIDTLLREKKELDGLTNASFKNNKEVLKYSALLDKLEDGQKVNIQKLLEQRDVVAALGRDFSELKRLTQENAQTQDRLSQKLLPLSETDAYLDALNRQRFLLRSIAKTNDRELTPTEQAKLDVIQKQMDFFGSVAGTENAVRAASLAITVAEAQAIAGKTKLIADEIKLETKIAQNKVKQFEAQQKLLQAQKLLKSEKEKEAALEAKALGGDDIAGQALTQMRETNNARERSIVQNQQNLALLDAQTAALERQLNTMHQLRDAAMQAFESNLQAGIAGLIKGTKDFKDALVDLAKGVLNSIADTLAKQLTTNIMKKITGAQDPSEKMRDAIIASGSTAAQKIEGALVAGGQKAANAIAAAVSGTPAGITAPASGGGTGTGTTASAAVAAAKDEEKEKVGFLERLFGKKVDKEADPKVGVVGTSSKGTPVVKDPGTTRVGGIFGPFLNDFSAIFEQNTIGGFVGQLGKTFMSGAEGFGSLFTDLLGGLFGGGGGGGLLGLFFRYGGVTPSYRYGGMSDRYSTGGIARGPQSGYPAILHGNEAIVPLPSGGKIPVEMKGGGGQTNNVGVTVNLSGDGQATTQMQGDPGQAEALGKAVSAAVQEELHKQRRPGGILSPYGAAGGI